MNIKDYLKDNILYLDGGMGTLLQAKGLLPGELPERWNISRPDVIKGIHRDYFDAGSNVVNSNTFGANSLKFSADELESIICAAIKNARDAAIESTSSQPKWVALDIGPTGKMLAPLGDFDFEEAVGVFAQTVKLGVKYGADLIFIETMNDSYETKAALLAAKENSSLPVFVSNAYGDDGKLMTGASPHAMVAMLEGMGADAIGVNCSLGPKALAPVVQQYLEFSSIPVLLKPNAGLPKSVEGKTVYDILPDEFAEEVSALIKNGVRIAGGCCGTTPDYIRATVQRCVGARPCVTTDKNITCVSSYSHAVVFDRKPILIGERINPTGKKRFKQALSERDMDYILKEGLNQQQKGVHILDVNVGLPEIDEVTMLKDTVCELQAIINLPLQIDTSDAAAMEAALRRYNGKAMINSVNGKKESMDAVFPLAKKYGGLIVALTLDENGIPEKAEKRLEIAKKILDAAAEYGIAKKDIIFDPLAMTVSADNNAPTETLKAVRLISALGCKTSLGVSNVSFGLPSRDIINGAFFTMALSSGLSAAIMNPYSDEMMKAYYSYCALSALDNNCNDYIEFASSFVPSASASAPTEKPQGACDYATPLTEAVVKGLKERAAVLTREMIKDKPPLDVVQQEIIPALDIVGKGFEEKTVYLPQLLMSAEAAKAAFEVIKEKMAGTGEAGTKCTIVIATVKGDIHDIGKNIVKLILENYGFNVVDLGKDVAPETIADTAVRLNAPIVGLSALMTTTVPAMEDTIKLIRQRAPQCKVMVGGAVLTQKYADEIGADKYAKDAMEAVRWADALYKKEVK